MGLRYFLRIHTHDPHQMGLRFSLRIHTHDPHHMGLRFSLRIHTHDPHQMGLRSSLRIHTHDPHQMGLRTTLRISSGKVTNLKARSHSANQRILPLPRSHKHSTVSWLVPVESKCYAAITTLCFISKLMSCSLRDFKIKYCAQKYNPTRASRPLCCSWLFFLLSWCFLTPLVSLPS